MRRVTGANFCARLFVAAILHYIARQCTTIKRKLQREADSAAGVPRRRWGIALLLGFGVLVNYLDR